MTYKKKKKKEEKPCHYLALEKKPRSDLIMGFSHDGPICGGYEQQKVQQRNQFWLAAVTVTVVDKIKNFLMEGFCRSLKKKKMANREKVMENFIPGRISKTGYILKSYMEI